jgi:hypothetical protein
MKHISPRKTNEEIHQMNKIFNHGFHRLTRINEIPSVSSVKSVVEFLRPRLAALCSPTLILCLVLGLMDFTVAAQIQQAWVAKYNNGITNGNHQALKMALDPSGNIYVLGVSQNANTNTGYVTIKYAPNGNQLWAARYDSANFPSATPAGFAVDNLGNVVVTGNAVTVKYDTNGNQLWSATNNAQAVAIDSGQNVYLTGVSSNFTTMKLNPAGSNLWTATWIYYGLSNLSQVIAVDAFSNVYVAGREGWPLDRNISVNVAVLKYDQNGNQLWETNSLNGAMDVDVHVVGLILDGSGNTYYGANLVGDAGGEFTTVKCNNNGSSGWVAYDPTGNGASVCAGLGLDTLGDVLVTGKNADYPPLPSYGTYKIDTNGNYVWGALYPMSSYGSSGALALALDSANNVYVTGSSTITNTGSDIATLKYDSNGNQLWVQRYNGPGNGNDAGNAIAVDNAGNVYVAGYETETNGSTGMVLIKYSAVALQRQSNGNVILQAHGSPGEIFDLQASTDLQTWVNLGTNSADTNGFVQFDDTNAPSFNCRFYYTVPQ